MLKKVVSKVIINDLFNGLGMKCPDNLQNNTLAIERTIDTEDNMVANLYIPAGKILSALEIPCPDRLLDTRIRFKAK
jgi:hypothetical protein